MKNVDTFIRIIRNTFGENAYIEWPKKHFNFLKDFAEANGMKLVEVLTI